MIFVYLVFFFFFLFFQMYDKEYYHPEHYVPKSIMKKMATPCLKKELQQLHANNMCMTADESELEFLKVTDTFL